MIEVDPFDLSKALGYESGFVLLNGTVWASLDMKDPFASDNFSSFGARDNVVHVELFPSSHFVLAGREPFDGIGAGHGFIVGLWLRGLDVGEIGMVIIRGNAVARIVVGDGGTNGALGTRERHDSRSGSGRWRSGNGRDGSRRDGSERVDGVRFENDSFLVPPFVEYDVTRLDKFACWSVHKVESGILLGEAQEDAQQGSS